MSATIVYSGPGKCFFNGIPFQSNGQSGQINAVLDEKSTNRGTAMHGEIRETLDDQTVKVTVTPFDQWGLLGTLFPIYVGATTTAGAETVAGGTGMLKCGQRAHDYFGGSVNGLAPLKIWRYDGELINFVRGAISKHPGMKLGVGQPLFDAMEFTCLGDATLNPGTSSFLIAGNAATEGVNAGGAGASDPDITGFFTTDFINGVWTGAYGAVSGFTALQAEDYWSVVPDIKYNMLTMQKLTRHMELASSRFMIKCRLQGPTHTQIIARLLSHTLGQTLQGGSATDLVLTGPSSKTITLKNCEPKGAGFEFGGTRLGTGEVGFVSSITFSAGVPQPNIIFSA